ncbi:MAG: hydrolase [Planctomycetes bacterium]|nr:hydrolase [Planctomycetota bacterium]
MKSDEPFSHNTQSPTTRSKSIPADACDCHVHIHGDPNQFPFYSGRTYTPEVALPETLKNLHESIGVSRVVIVTPSVYGTDNSSTLYGIREFGPRARGVAVIGDATTEEELDHYQASGISGIRLNLGTAGITDVDEATRRLKSAIHRVDRRGWHVQIFTTLDVLSGLKNVIADAEIPIVIDHFGGAIAELGTTQKGFDDLLDLLRTGRCYVKISAAYRISKRTPDYSDVQPLVRELIAARSDRVLWGTDWPHPNAVTPSDRQPTETTPHLSIDDRHLFHLLMNWIPDAQTREQVLVSNPARLYGFPE